MIFKKKLNNKNRLIPFQLPSHVAFLSVAKEWKDKLLVNDIIWEQNGFNEIVRIQLTPSINVDIDLFILLMET